MEYIDLDTVWYTLVISGYIDIPIGLVRVNKHLNSLVTSNDVLLQIRTQYGFQMSKFVDMNVHKIIQAGGCDTVVEKSLKHLVYAIDYSSISNRVIRKLANPLSLRETVDRIMVYEPTEKTWSRALSKVDDNERKSILRYSIMKSYFIPATLLMYEYIKYVQTSLSEHLAMCLSADIVRVGYDIAGKDIKKYNVVKGFNVNIESDTLSQYEKMIKELGLLFPTPKQIRASLDYQSIYPGNYAKLARWIIENHPEWSEMVYDSIPKLKGTSLTIALNLLKVCPSLDWSQLAIHAIKSKNTILFNSVSLSANMIKVLDGIDEEVALSFHTLYFRYSMNWLDVVYWYAYNNHKEQFLKTFPRIQENPYAVAQRALDLGTYERVIANCKSFYP